MRKITVRELLYITGGSTKVLIINSTNGGYVRLWQGYVDNVDFNNVPYGDSEIGHTTVVGGEDILQIYLEV